MCVYTVIIMFIQLALAAVEEIPVQTNNAINLALLQSDEVCQLTTPTFISNLNFRLFNLGLELAQVWRTNISGKDLHVHTYMYMCTYIHYTLYIDTYILTCTYNTYIHTYIHTCTYMYITTYIYTYTYMHTYIHTYAYIHTYTYMCMHTNNTCNTCTYIHTFTYMHIQGSLMVSEPRLLITSEKERQVFIFENTIVFARKIELGQAKFKYEYKFRIAVS